MFCLFVFQRCSFSFPFPSSNSIKHQTSSIHQNPSKQTAQHCNPAQRPPKSPKRAHSALPWLALLGAVPRCSPRAIRHPIPPPALRQWVGAPVFPRCCCCVSSACLCPISCTIQSARIKPGATTFLAAASKSPIPSPLTFTPSIQEASLNW